MLGDRIKQIRESQNKGLNETAELAGISGSYLSTIENNKKKNPSMSTLDKIAEALGVSVDEFFKEDREATTSEPAKQETKGLDLVPEQFTDPDQARAYVKKHRIFSSEGFNADKIDDERILEFANALLEQMKMVGYKFEKEVKESK